MDSVGPAHHHRVGVLAGAAGEGGGVESGAGEVGTAVGGTSVGGVSVGGTAVAGTAVVATADGSVALAAASVDTGSTTSVVDDEVARADTAWAWPPVKTALPATTKAAAATIASRVTVARPAEVRVRRI